MVDDCIYVPTWKPINIEHPWISLNIPGNLGPYKVKEINSKPQNYMNQEGRVPGLPDSFSGVEARSGGRIQLGFYWAIYIYIYDLCELYWKLAILGAVCWLYTLANAQCMPYLPRWYTLIILFNYQNFNSAAKHFSTFWRIPNDKKKTC